MLHLWYKNLSKIFSISFNKKDENELKKVVGTILLVVWPPNRINFKMTAFHYTPFEFTVISYFISQKINIHALPIHMTMSDFKQSKVSFNTEFFFSKTG